MIDEIVGIDLGTTNSEIAIYRDGKPEILADELGRKILPSVVGLTEAGEILVGEEARNQALLYPERTIRSIKRRMGQADSVRMADHDAGDLRDHPEAVEGDRRTPAGARGAQGGDHRAGVFLRHAAPGDA
jgi:molecular chaperone DnaK (HSP70)